MSLSNLFITNDEGMIICNRFISTVCSFIDDYLTAKLIDIPFNCDVWLYMFINEINILHQIRYDNFVKPYLKKYKKCKN